MSCDDAERVFAAGSLTNRLRIEVAWRSGKTSVLEGAEANRVYEIHETGAAAQPIVHPITNGPPLFDDVSNLLQHTNVDEPFDDFSFQPLLPRKLSSLGPSVAWIDYNRDGLPDLAIAGSRGGKLTLFRNNGHGGFINDTNWNFPTLTRDQTSIVALKTTNRTSLIIASSNYEDPKTNTSSLQIYTTTNGSISESAISATTSPRRKPLRDDPPSFPPPLRTSFTSDLAE